MAFCVTICGDDNKLGRMIYDQWKFYRGVNVQGSFTDESVPSEVQTIEDMLKNRFVLEFQPDNYSILVDNYNTLVKSDVEDMLKNLFVLEFQPDNYSLLVKSAKFMEKDFDDTEEWAMTEREFREWYFTHSHKETMAFYNFLMQDTGNFRKIAPKIVEKELYKQWKEDPVFFTDMVNEFEDKSVEEYTFV